MLIHYTKIKHTVNADVQQQFVGFYFNCVCIHLILDCFSSNYMIFNDNLDKFCHVVYFIELYLSWLV